jgi:phospholipid transport system substrate-binding protein
MTFDLSRRTVLAGLGASAVTLAGASQAFALTTAQAEALVNKLVNDINKVISSGQSEAAMIKSFEGFFARYADVPTMGRYTLGADARRISAGQLRSYTTAFQGYLARKYGKRFREFVGGRLEVKGARQVKSFYEVKTTAFLQGSSPFEVTFLVSDRSGKDLFFNMFIEGINMLLTERTEIGSMLDARRGNIDQLIADLRTAS